MAVEVLGVYAVPGNPDVSLIEVTVDRPPSGVDVGDFTQEDPNSDRENWQVPYDERYLNSDGTQEIGERWESWRLKPGSEEPPTTRLVFYIHFLVSGRVLLTPDGDVALPPAQALPSRLAFVEYEPPD